MLAAVGVGVGVGLAFGCAEQGLGEGKPASDAGTSKVGEGVAPEGGASSHETKPDADANGASSSCGCKGFERCVAGVCKAVPTANISLGTVTLRQGPITAQFSFQNQVCFYRLARPDPPAPSQTPTLVDGLCALSERDVSETPLMPWKTFEGDIGVVTVTGGSAGVNTLQRTASNLCYQSNLGIQVPIFSAGDHLVVQGTGGADFPAFTLEIDAPPAVIVERPLYQRGEPLPVKWSGATNDSVLLTVTSRRDDRFVTVSCTVADTGTFIVPATITSQLGLDVTTSVNRLRSTRFEPKDQDVLVQVQVQTTDGRSQ